MAYDDPAMTDNARAIIGAKLASDALRDRMNSAFWAASERSRRSFEDCRLLLMNGVKP